MSDNETPAPDLEVVDKPADTAGEDDTQTWVAFKDENGDVQRVKSQDYVPEDH
jgi:hypothetical protein